jgi:hypothetical protein
MAQQPDAMEFRYDILKGELDEMDRPHALAAFRNGGGGPLYACGDIAAFAGPVSTPSTSPAPPQGLRPPEVRACRHTRGVDASGVTSVNGSVGIVGGTYGSASSVTVYDRFVMVRKGARVGDRISVAFEQIGSSAPASSVSYGVTAAPRSDPWGDSAFELGVKPIGFANSCWRLLVDGADSGIVLLIGP